MKLPVAILLTTLAINTNAGFIDESSQNPFSAHAQVRVLGDGAIDQAYGFAKGVPLQEAVAQIIPRAYTVRFRGVERIASTPVEWRGSKPWVDVIRDVALQVPSLRVEIDTTAKLATLSSEMSHEGGSAVLLEGSIAITNPLVTTWELRKDDLTVKAVFDRWARTANWDLVWDINVDYPIAANAVLQGTFEQAVEEVTRSMQSSSNPPKAVFYQKNNVLRIINRGME